MPPRASYLRLLDAANKLPTPINSPAELARYFTLGGVKVSEQMMTNWKARGVPKGKALDVAAMLHTTADYILYGKEPDVPAPALPVVRDPILDDLAVLLPHEAERWRIRIKAAADERRLDLRATQEVSQQQEDYSTSSKTKDDPHIEKSLASR